MTVSYLFFERNRFFFSLNGQCIKCEMSLIDGAEASFMALVLAHAPVGNQPFGFSGFIHTSPGR